MVPRLPLLALALLPALPSCGGGSSRDARAAQRLLVVGWDGATFDLIDRLVAQGRLPNLARLMSTGRSAWLESTKVPISSAAWTGAATGHGPGETGIYDFFARVEGTYDVRVIDAHANRRPPLWRILSGRGMGVNVFGVPITWPPEPVTGRMVSGMLSPTSGTYAQPPEYADELRARGFVPDVGMWTQLKQLSMGVVQEQLTIKERALLELLQRDDWQLTWVVFKSLDVVSHFMYDGRTDSPVARVLDRLDEILGALVAAAGPDTDVLVVSDHGFGNYPFGFNVHAWLVAEGYALEEDGGPVALTYTPLGEYQAELHHERLERLDLARTRVLPTNTECEGNYGSLRLNLAGREPQGVVQPERAAALLDELEAALLGFQPEGRPIVTRVWRGRELYPGPHAAAVPDLIFETVPDHQVVANTEEATLTRYERPRAEHTLDGIFVAAGPRIAPSDQRERFQILDLAPIALHLLEQPLYAEMSGDPRPHLLAEPRPVQRIPQADDPFLHAPDPAWKPVPLSAEERAERQRQLAALGYADGGGNDEQE